MGKRSEPELPVSFDESINYQLSLYDTLKGGFRFAQGLPPSLMATCYAILGLELTNSMGLLAPGARDSVIKYLKSGLQSDGTFIDPDFSAGDISSSDHDIEYFREETTSFCQQALDALSAPVPERKWPVALLTPLGLISLFESYHWKNPWVDSNRVMFILSQFCHDAERHRKNEYLVLVDAALDWLDRQQDLQTGLWHGQSGAGLSDAAAAAFHFIFFYIYRNRPLRYAEKIIDSCLSLHNSCGLFARGGFGHTCLDYDIIYLLYYASLTSSYRRHEVSEIMDKTAKDILKLKNEDGGFAHSKGILRHGDLMSRIKRKLSIGKPESTYMLLPNKTPYHTGTKFLSAPSDESNALSTWFRVLTIILAESFKNPGGYYDKIKFRALPFLGFNDGLAIQAAKGISSTIPYAKSRFEVRGNASEKGLTSGGPRITAIIPAHNAEKYLGNTLSALRRQTYGNWEAIVIDDGSSDKTPGIALSWADVDKRIRVIRQENRGLGAARNAGIREAQGELVHCIDADDLIEPDFYAKTVKRYIKVKESGERLSCIVSSAYMFWGNARILQRNTVAPDEYFSLSSITKMNPAQPVCYVFEREILRHTGYFDETIRHCHDWDMWLRFARIGVEFIRCPEAWAFYRVLPSSLSSNYIKYLNTGREVLQRTLYEDGRLDAGRHPLQGKSEDVIAGTCRFWYLNFLRIINRNDKVNIEKIFFWAKETMPGSFWTDPGSIGEMPLFKWSYDAPPPEVNSTGELHGRLRTYMSAMETYWPEYIRKHSSLMNRAAVIEIIKAAKNDNISTGISPAGVLDNAKWIIKAGVGPKQALLLSYLTAFGLLKAICQSVGLLY